MTENVGPVRGRKIPNANGRKVELSQATGSAEESTLGQAHKMLSKIMLLLPQASDPLERRIRATIGEKRNPPAQVNPPP